MSKDVLIFSDGTGQAGGLRPDQRLSNIYKLYRATRSGPDSPIDPSKQVAFYDPGLGTISDAGGIHLSVLDKFLAIFGLATGMGITDKIIDCYAAILKNYRPGDRISLFGFSRGAYTARCVAVVLRLCGVPTHDGNNQKLPTDGPELRRIAREAVVNVYEHRFMSRNDARVSAREAAAVKFREKYGSTGADPDSSNAAVEFIGVFDTVAALGARGWRLAALVAAVAATFALASTLSARVLHLLAPAWFPMWLTAGCLFAALGLSLGMKLIAARWKARGFDKSLDPRTGYARHARAIDEARADFDVLGWSHSSDVQQQQRNRANGEWLVQVWFAGNHSDIGGSYPEDESRLSDIALDWMVEELKTCVPSISINAEELTTWARGDGLQHCEVQYSREQWWRPTWRTKVRPVDPEAVLHPTVVERFELPLAPLCRRWAPYRPDALRHHRAVAHYYPSEQTASD